VNSKSGLASRLWLQRQPGDFDVCAYLYFEMSIKIKLNLDFYASLGYAKSVKIKSEVDNLPLPDNLQSFLSQNGGTVTTAQANHVGISNERLRLLVKSGDLERVAFGVYISPDEFVDKMYVTQLRRPKIIYSHETSLFLHDLTDRDPTNYTITVPTGYNATRLRADGLTVFTIKRELHEFGVTQLLTMFGNEVAVYGLERTICDCLRSRNQMDIAVVTDAVKRYVRCKEKNINTLMQMAEAFNLTKLLRSYMEVLL
jgi:predicted transcriptional regulator of viral defense system